MERVDFHILPSVSSLDYTIQLCARLYPDRQVLIYVDEEDICTSLDELLWTFDRSSFLAHDRRYSNDEALISHIHIAHSSFNPAPCNYQALINLTTQIPLCRKRIAHIYEIVANIEELKKWARKRFLVYREEGFHVYTHHIKH